MKARLDLYKSSGNVMRGMLALEEHVKKSGLEQALTELVRLRASQINGCAFCVDLHSSDARKGGETERRLAAVAVWRDTPFFSDRERAALEWTEAVTLVSSTHVPDDTWERVKPHFSEAELADLTLLVVAINGWNRLSVAFRKLPV